MHKTSINIKRQSRKDWFTLVYVIPALEHAIFLWRVDQVKEIVTLTEYIESVIARGAFTFDEEFPG